MSDYKDMYSEMSKYYIESAQVDSIEKERYNRSKLREEMNNEKWKQQCVNLNDIVKKFVLDFDEQVELKNEGGIKYVFEGSRYIVKCDKVAGYLRIYDKEKKIYCKMDGTPSHDNDLTHFKIKKREEM